jgi:predicted deacylase
MRTRLDTVALNARVREVLPIAMLADGSRMDVPVVVLSGAHKRPRLVCVTGIHGDEPEGLMTRCVIEAGIPAIGSEIGGLDIVTPDGTSVTKSRVQALMMHLGMVEGAVAPGQGRIVDQFEFAAPCGGFLNIGVPLGTEVNAGDALGLVRAPDGGVLDRIAMPHRGLLGAVRRAARVQAGERIARLFPPYPGVEAG